MFTVPSVGAVRTTPTTQPTTPPGRLYSFPLFSKNNIHLNSSQIDKLGNWCLKGQQGAKAISQRGGIHGNPHKRLLTGNTVAVYGGVCRLWGWFTLNNQWKQLIWPIFTKRPATKRERGEGVRIRKDLQIECIRSAKISKEHCVRTVYCEGQDRWLH